MLSFGYKFKEEGLKDGIQGIQQEHEFFWIWSWREYLGFHGHIKLLNEINKHVDWRPIEEILVKGYLSGQVWRGQCRISSIDVIEGPFCCRNGLGSSLTRNWRTSSMTGYLSESS